MECSVIFAETLRLMRQPVRRLVHQGGQSSGKTVNILAAIATVLAEQPLTATITSMSFPHLKAGAMRDFDRYVLPSFSNTIRQYRKSDHTLIWNSGAIMEFRTYETEYDARGPKRDILFANEGNTFDYMTWWQLDSRSTLSIVDYNPTIRFWAHEKVIGEKGTALRISDHRHNPFLTAEKHAEIEGIKDTELWRVYARGLTGNVQGLIYPNWVIIDGFDWSEEAFFAIDFGYTNDPTAIVKMELRRGSLYIQEIAYKTGAMTAKRIKEVLLANGYNEDDSILYCEHDPHMIRQLKDLDVRAVAAKKGDGSLKAGIEKMKEYDVFYMGRNIKSEREKYIWLMDEMGNPTNKPVDGHNHALDAARYGAYTHFYRAA